LTHQFGRVHHIGMRGHATVAAWNEEREWRILRRYPGSNEDRWDQERFIEPLDDPDNVLVRFVPERPPSRATSLTGSRRIRRSVRWPLKEFASGKAARLVNRITKLKVSQRQIAGLAAALHRGTLASIAGFSRITTRQTASTWYKTWSQPTWPSGCSRFGLGILTLDHADLVTQDQVPGVTGAAWPVDQGEPAEHPEHSQVGELPPALLCREGLPRLRARDRHGYHPLSTANAIALMTTSGRSHATKCPAPWTLWNVTSVKNVWSSSLQSKGDTGSWSDHRTCVGWAITRSCWRARAMAQWR
jgi:hypothetical protein